MADYGCSINFISFEVASESQIDSSVSSYEVSFKKGSLSAFEMNSDFDDMESSQAFLNLSNQSVMNKSSGFHSLFLINYSYSAPIFSNSYST